MYPECSKKAVKTNKIAICGTKIKIPDNPERSPSTSKLVYQAVGSVSEMIEIIEVNAPSIKSIGYVCPTINSLKHSEKKDSCDEVSPNWVG